MSLAKGSAAPWARRWAPALAWSVVIVVLTSIPNVRIPVDLSYSDEIAHFGVYTILGLLSGHAMLRPRPLGRVVGVLVAIAIFGALDEVHQYWIPNRLSTVSDWIADLLGASVGLFAYHFRPGSQTPRANPTS